MYDANREIAIKKITEMSIEQVSKLLIFMAGMEAQQAAEKTSRLQSPCPMKAIRQFDKGKAGIDRASSNLLSD